MPLLLQQGSKGSYRVSTGESGLVSCWTHVTLLFSPVYKGVRPPVELRWGSWSFSRGAMAESDLPSCCEGKLRAYSSRCRAIWPYLDLRGTQCSFTSVKGTQGTSHVASGNSSLLSSCEWESGLLASQAALYKPASSHTEGRIFGFSQLAGGSFGPGSTVTTSGASHVASGKSGLL